MASSMIDSALYRNSFGTPEMREIFDDRSMMANMLAIEIAMTEVQGELGLIPADAVKEIVSKGKVENMDFAAIESEINRIGHSLVPLIRYWQKICTGGAGEYIHLGATTQDIIDTAFMLCYKKAFAVIYNDACEAEEHCLALVKKYKDTVMAGRSHTQQAIPITFGFKAAVWASELRRDIERLQECWKRCFVGELYGAVGTLASFGENGLHIAEESIRRVGLDVPDIAWHVSRDRIGEIVTTLGLLCCTMGRIGKEIASLQKTEIGELAEGFTPGAVGSSTMPHKRNPNGPEAMQMLARAVKSSMDFSMESMFCEHERDGAFWKLEWKAVADTIIMAGACIAKGKKVLKNLDVFPEAMKENLYKLRGLMMSEKVMLALGKIVGKQTAHEIVYQISMKSFEQKRDFGELLMANETIATHFTKEQIDKLLDPAAYTGESAFLAERVYGRSMAARQNDLVIA